MMVLFHSFMGMRTVLADYMRSPRARMIALTVLGVTALFLVVIGTAVVMTLPVPGAG
jgi:succinate dehydrogenase hydrophobic anchor subunit